MTAATLTVAEAAVRIVASPAPVLFPDTCALVDLVRLPLRKEGQEVTRELVAAGDLLSRASAAAAGVWVVVPPLVPAEWEEHAEREREALASSWVDLDAQSAATHAAAEAFGLESPLPSMVTLFEGTERRLWERSRALLNAGIRLSIDTQSENRGVKRAYGKVAPGHRGSGVKDCVIAEHAISVARLLGPSFGPPRVLLTSNVADFCVSKGDKAPRPPLDADFSEVGIALTTTWQWARAALLSQRSDGE